MKKDFLVGFFVYLLFVVYSGYQFFVVKEFMGYMLAVLLYPVVLFPYMYQLKDRVLGLKFYHIVFWIILILGINSIIFLYLYTGDNSIYIVTAYIISVNLDIVFTIFYFGGYILFWVNSARNYKVNLWGSIVLFLVSFLLVYFRYNFEVSRVLYITFYTIGLYLFFRIYFKQIERG